MRKRFTDSEKILNKAVNQRANMPIALDLKPIRQITVKPEELANLRTDRKMYQRAPNQRLINYIATALKHGHGKITDPVSLVKRLYGPQANRGWYYVGDGQQRVEAAKLAGVPVPADVYEVESEEQERKLYYVLNYRMRQNANNAVKAWHGIGARMLREMSSDSNCPVFERIAWDNSSASRFDASILITGMAVAASGKLGGRKIENVLSRLDDLITNDPEACARAASFVELAPQCFTGERPKRLPVIALAVVAYEHWNKSLKQTMPTNKAIGLFKRINWDSVEKSSSEKYLPQFIAKVKKTWGEAE